MWFFLVQFQDYFMKLQLEMYKRFLNSERIIHSHLVKDFPISLLLSYQIRFLHLLSFILLMIVGKPMLATYGYILSLHSLNLMYLAIVNMYIMFFCNTITTEFLMQSLKTATYVAASGYMGHNAMSIYILPPNSISNAYHIYSPTGRGYGAYSCSQLMAVDALKGAQGPSFDPKTIVNSDYMIDSQKLSHQFAKTKDLPTLHKFITSKSS